MKNSVRRAVINSVNAGVVTLADQHRAARALRAEWETFLARAEFDFQEDALSRETVSLEDAGLEEEAAVDTVPGRKLSTSRKKRKTGTRGPSGPFLLAQVVGAATGL